MVCNIHEGVFPCVYSCYQPTVGWWKGISMDTTIPKNNSRVDEIVDQEVKHLSQLISQRLFG